MKKSTHRFLMRMANGEVKKLRVAVKSSGDKHVGLRALARDLFRYIDEDLERRRARA